MKETLVAVVTRVGEELYLLSRKSATTSISSASSGGISNCGTPVLFLYLRLKYRYSQTFSSRIPEIFGSLTMLLVDSTNPAAGKKRLIHTSDYWA